MGIGAYQRSQSRKPSDMPPWRTTSASGHLPATPLNPPARLSPSPLSAPPMPPPLCSTPPSRYLGQRTCLIFSHTASISRDKVSHTDSSIVLVGARLSSPGIDELRYDLDRGLREEDDWMLPVNGTRSEVDCRVSSRSLIFAASTYVSIGNKRRAGGITIVWIYEILLNLGIVIVIIGIARRCTCHHGHRQQYTPARTIYLVHQACIGCNAYCRIRERRSVFRNIYCTGITFC